MSEPFEGYALMERIVGRRMAMCELRNYKIGDDKFSAIRQLNLNAVTEYAKNLQQSPIPGTNLIIWGPMGTGKDHLACSVIRVALGYGIDCAYIRGSALCGLMLQKSRSGAQSVVPTRYATVPLLVISDIEPRKRHSQGLSGHDTIATEFEERALLELIDKRYLDCLPTVITSNATGQKRLSNLIGLRTVDRLLDDSVRVETTGPSYRTGG